MNDDGAGDSNEVAALIESDFGTPSTQTVPDVWPDVPLIAINRYPLFPGFIKKVDVCLSIILEFYYYIYFRSSKITN